MPSDVPAFRRSAVPTSSLAKLAVTSFPGRALAPDVQAIRASGAFRSKLGSAHGCASGVVEFRSFNPKVMG